MIKVVLFDVGGVLEDRSEVSKNIIEISIDSLNSAGLQHDNLYQLVTSYRQNLSTIFGEKPFENRYFYWRDLIELLQKDKVRIKQIRQVYASYLRHYVRLVELYDDVIPCLDQLKSNGLELAIVTNATMEKTELFLKKFHLSEYWTEHFISEMIGSNKPLSMIFQYALNKLSISSNEAMHIGDRIETDLRGANFAGIEAILVQRDTMQPLNILKEVKCKPLDIIDSLFELPDIIANISLSKENIIP